MDYHALSYWDVAIAASLVFINGIISVALKLHLGRSLLLGSVRTVLQLGLIGFILKWIFTINHVSLVLLILFIMTSIAALNVRGRNSYTYHGQLQDAFVSILLPAWAILFIGMLIVMRVQPWYAPQYIIPIAGMIIGNVLTGVSLVMDRLLNELSDKKDSIEMLISLGATPWESYLEIARKAMSAGMMPTINSMMVVGLVSLPGMMTGQILAGQDPEQAVRYQIIVMFFLTAATGLACMLVVYSLFKRLFNKQGVFLYQRLHEAKK